MSTTWLCIGMVSFCRCTYRFYHSKSTLCCLCALIWRRRVSAFVHQLADVLLISGSPCWRSRPAGISMPYGRDCCHVQLLNGSFPALLSLLSVCDDACWNPTVVSTRARIVRARKSNL